MFARHPRAKHLLMALSVTGVLALGLAAPVAADTVTQSVTSTGILAIDVPTPTFGDITRSLEEQNSPSSINFTVTDETGSYSGWNVTMQMTTDFEWTGAGTARGIDIPAENLTYTPGELAVVGAGQAINEDMNGELGTGGPTASSLVTLEDARTVLAAAPGFGSGAYTQANTLDLTIPANAAVGMYTGTLTTTIAAGPAAPEE